MKLYKDICSAWICRTFAEIFSQRLTSQTSQKCNRSTVILLRTFLWIFGKWVSALRVKYASEDIPLQKINIVCSHLIRDNIQDWKDVRTKRERVFESVQVRIRGRVSKFRVFIVHVLYGLSSRALTWPISCTKGGHIWEPKEKIIIGAVTKHGVILILGEKSSFNTI